MHWYVRDQNVSCRVDESDVSFTIVSEVEVEVPNGGEEYQAMVAPFTSTGVYLMDNGTIVTDGGRFFDNGGESSNYSDASFTKYFWPATSSNELRMTFTRFHTHNGNDHLRVRDATTNQQLLHVSGNYTPSLHDSPLVAQGRGLKVEFSACCGGTASGWDANIESIEVEYDNATHPILWDITGTSKEFDLDYSVNGGLTWKRIVSNYYTLTGEYDWPVPNEASETALVRVTDSENGDVVDVSDAVFTILAGEPLLNIIQPNSAEILYAGATYDVQWNSRFLASQYVKLELSLDNGAQWFEVQDNVLNDGSFDWVVPETYSTTCLLKITDMGDSTVYDESDIIFTISPPIVMTTQNSVNSNYRSCTVANINWFAGGTSGVYDILLSLDDGVTWNPIEEGYTDGSSFVSYSWYVPNEITLNARVRVIDANDSDKFDEGDQPFQISPTINLNSFNFGGLYTIGNEYQVLWQDTLTSEQYNLDYSVDNGSSWSSIAENYVNPLNSFDWLIPNNPSQEVILRIEDATNSCKSTQSAIPFTLTHFEPTIEVQYPNGGEIFNPGEFISIQWVDPGENDAYNIEFSTNAGQSWELIEANYSSFSQSLDWEIPEVPSLLCLVRVRDAANSNHYDISNYAFQIQDTPNDCGAYPCDQVLSCTNFFEFDLSEVATGIYPGVTTELEFQVQSSTELTLFINSDDIEGAMNPIEFNILSIEVSELPLGLTATTWPLPSQQTGMALSCLTIEGSPLAFGLFEVNANAIIEVVTANETLTLQVDLEHDVLVSPPDNILFGCVYGSASNYDENALLDAGNCLFTGCTVPDACNYQIHANVDDGSCNFDCTAPPNSFCQGDLDGDNQVTINDLLLLLGVFGDVCPE